MASTVSVPLNAEPSLPEERKQQRLEPKSYVDAVQEEPPVNGTNGANTNGTNNVASNEAQWMKPSPHKASVLRIVDTGADVKEKETKQENENERPQFERQESKHEYSAAVGFALKVSLTITNYLRASTIHPEPLLSKGIADPGLRRMGHKRRTQMKSLRPMVLTPTARTRRSKTTKRTQPFSRKFRASRMAASLSASSPTLNSKKSTEQTRRWPQSPPKKKDLPVGKLQARDGIAVEFDLRL
jgi:2-acylglycerol O-acyltransferase 2